MNNEYSDLDDVIGAIADGVDINYFDNNLNTALRNLFS